MDKDFEIEIQGENVEDTRNVQLPMNFLRFGEIENDDVKVYIKQDVYKVLEKLAASDTTKELGSIILGEYCQEHGKTHIIISQYIEAKYTDASASTLTFTHETWDYVHSEHERRYPDKKIIGWQHTHPNYGIFLSNYDMFIQENFFNLPFQVAYVIDPIQNLRGFFQWKNGRIEKLKGYYIYDDIGKPIKIEQTKRKTEGIKQPAKQSRASLIVIVLLCIITIILSFSVGSLNHAYKEQQKKQDAILSQLDDQNEVITNQSITITQLQEQLGDSQTSVDDLIEMIENNKITIHNQDTVIKELQELVGVPGENNANSVEYVSFVAYTVVAGDSLSNICEKNGIDYQANKNAILAINGIVNDNLIYIGQKILIPVYN